MDEEAGKPSRFAFYRNLAVMLFNDTVGYSQPESGSFPNILGSKKRVEYMIDDFRRDTNPVIFKDDANTAFPINREYRRGANFDRAPRVERVERIGKQIDKHLLE